MKAHITTAPLSEINEIFERLAAGKVDGRVVLDFSAGVTNGHRSQGRRTGLIDTKLRTPPLRRSHYRNARKALRMTTTSMASCSSAPCTGGR